jgi:hypothetical protein
MQICSKEDDCANAVAFAVDGCKKIVIVLCLRIGKPILWHVLQPIRSVSHPAATC